MATIHHGRPRAINKTVISESGNAHIATRFASSTAASRCVARSSGLLGSTAAFVVISPARVARLYSWHVPTPVSSQFFVGVGVAKAGTSWFGHYFAAHPQVWFSPVKELHVFDQLLVPEHCGVFTSRFDRRIERLQGRQVPHTERTAGLLDGSLARRSMVEADSLDTTIDLYRSFFSERSAGSVACGEITPSYSLLPAAGYQAMLEAYPDAKFLLVLRDPVDRFWSHLRFKSGRQPGFDPIREFETMLAASGAALRSEYDDLLERFLPAVPEAQRLVVFFEDVFVDGDDAPVKRVSDALGLDYVTPDLGEIVKQSPSGSLPDEWAVLAARRFERAYAACIEAFGRVPDRWLRHQSLAS